jgi:hypothetical protein
MRIKSLLVTCLLSAVAACSSNAATGGQTNPTAVSAPTKSAARAAARGYSRQVSGISRWSGMEVRSRTSIPEAWLRD